MKRTRVNAIVQALLEPDTRTQEAVRRKRIADDRVMAQKRKVAWFMVIGCTIGGVVAHSMNVRFTEGIIWGGISSSALGWLFYVGLGQYMELKARSSQSSALRND